MELNGYFEFSESIMQRKESLEYVENDLDVVSVIEYLNTKTRKQFTTYSKATARLMKRRFCEGYTVVDCKKVIDTKANDWLDNPHWQKYLRPSTIFNLTNFENHLEESRGGDLSVSSLPKPFELDFSKGEV